MNRRTFLCALAGTAGAFVSAPAFARPQARGPGWPQITPFPEDRPGIVFISLGRRRLYLTQGDGTALSWPVAVGKPGKAWTGATRIAGKHVNPAWAPPAMVRRDVPGLPDVIPGGAPNNPMGARALVLEKAEIAIHGTSASMRASIGSAASYGCIRMLNEHIVDLFDRVSVGTPVIALA